MADRVSYSLWLRGFTEHNMLAVLEKVLAQVPYSRLLPGGALSIHAVDYSEPTVFDRRLDQAPEPAEIVRLCREFAGSDCAFQVEAYWDLWSQREAGEWKLGPAPLSITCYGPLFPSDLGEQVLIEFGLDTQFLPGEGTGPELAAIRSNIRSLLHLTADLGKNLAVEKKTLWSESGENLAERLEAVIAELG